MFCVSKEREIHVDVWVSITTHTRARKSTVVGIRRSDSRVYVYPQAKGNFVLQMNYAWKLGILISPQQQEQQQRNKRPTDLMKRVLCCQNFIALYCHPILTPKSKLDNHPQ